MRGGVAFSSRDTDSADVSALLANSFDSTSRSDLPSSSWAPTSDFDEATMVHEINLQPGAGGAVLQLSARPDAARELSRGEEMRKWHQENQSKLAYKAAMLTTVFLCVVISPVLVGLFLAWTALGVVMVQLPLPLMASLWSTLCLGIYLGGGGGGTRDSVLQEATYDFTSSSFDVLIASAIVPPLIAALCCYAGREHGQTLPDDENIYDSLGDDESVHNGGKEARRHFPDPWGRWHAGPLLTVAVINLLLVIIKGTALRADSPGAWRGLLAAYTIGVTCVCLSSMRLWRPTSAAQYVEAEIRLLRSEAVGHFNIRQSAGLHTLEFWGEKNPTRSSEKPVLVMLPGFGAVASFYVLNTRKLAEDYRVLCVDWLGTGGSKRTPFRREKGEDAEAYFVEALEAWRVKEDIDRFFLVGHSLGGVLATSYTLRHPERVCHLILASPCTPRVWYDDDESIPAVFRVVAKAWGSGLTPMAVIRWMGPLGPGFVRRAVTRRFTRGGRSPPTNLNLLAAITWHNYGMRGCGENMLSGVLQPGARPHLPLEDRLPEKLKVPCSFMYGAGPDWMDWTKGQYVVDKLREKGVPASLHLVKKAGHQLFLDEPAEASSVLRLALSSLAPSPAVPGQRTDAVLRDQRRQHFRIV